MKILLRILSLLIILYVNSDAQTVTWQKWYDYNNYEDNGQDVIQTFDGGYLILSINYIPLNNSSVVTKTDQYGNIQWQKLYDRNNIGGLSVTCYTVTQTADSGYVISGGNRGAALLLKTDKLGEILWIKTYIKSNFFSGSFLNHKITENGGIIACGYLYDPSNAYVVKTDSSGNLEWDSVYSYVSNFISVVESKDESLYFLGGLTKLFKTNKYGKLIWQYQNLSNTTDLIEHPSGDIYVGSGHDSLILTRIDSSGNLIFEKSFYQGINGCMSMCLSNDNNIILAGADNGRMAVSKINYNGNLLFNKLILTINNTAYAFLPIAVNSSNDSGFIFTGFTNYPPTFHESNIYVTKTDSLCNAPLIVNIENNNSIIPDNITLHQNYPNPFNPETIINYELRITNLVTLKVYDILGMEVATLVHEVQFPGSYNYQFSTASYQLPSGIYFYRLETGEFSQVRKMTILK